MLCEFIHFIRRPTTFGDASYNFDPLSLTWLDICQTVRLNISNNMLDFKYKVNEVI